MRRGIAPKVFPRHKTKKQTNKQTNKKTEKKKKPVCCTEQSKVWCTRKIFFSLLSTILIRIWVNECFRLFIFVNCKSFKDGRCNFKWWGYVSQTYEYFKLIYFDRHVQTRFKTNDSFFFEITLMILFLPISTSWFSLTQFKE